MRIPSPSEPELISLREAATRAGRSYSWAWSKAAVGRLEKRQDAAGRTMVTARSVAAAIARDSAQRRSRTQPGGHLRLIIDNTK
ncbi:hypothetical protein [Paracoccus sp. 22332]|uniref:hypothetical protein n=1 Tax=Paracoccus sp. 22332 TaxID=3453913 RepID=UPI003F84D5A6